MKKILSLVVMLGCMTMSLPVSARSKKKLSTDYEIVIANNTKKPLHWHLKTSGNDYNGNLEPGAVKDNLFTGNFLDRLEITFKEHGQQERRGYKVPGLQSGKDWIFSVDGEPFTGNWTVCGMWKDTAAQGAATMAGIIGGITIATTILVVLSAGTASGLYAAEAATISTTMAVAEAATAVGFTDVALSTGVIIAEATAAQTAILASAGVAATTIVGAGAGTVAGVFESDPDLAKLAAEMTYDKCEWHYNKRITLKNGSSDYMMVIQDAEKSVGVLPGKTFVVRQALLDDKIKIKAYFESSKEDLLGEKEKVKRRNVTFTHDSKGWHVAKSGTNFNDDAETESRKTTFKNESAMPVSIIRNEKMSEPVEILAAQETDAAGNKVTDEVTNEHMLSDNFRYYGYMDKPIEQEVAISWDKGDATLTLNGSTVGISYSK